MTKLHLVEPFQDLDNKITMLKTQLKQYCTLKDLVSIIENINLVLSGLEKNDFNYLELIKLRQRAYEKRNKLRKDNQMGLTGEDENSRDSFLNKSNQEITIKNSKIFERIQMTPRYCCLILLIVFFSFLLGIQSFYIYQAIGMEMPYLVSIGSILMTIGVGIFIQTKVRVMNCLIILYETILLLSGTFLQEQLLQRADLGKEKHYGFLQEEYQKFKRDYDLVNFRYENKESKMYQNSWYKKQVIDPAWEKVNSSIQRLTFKEKDVLNGTNFYIIVVLKILFRVGVVCLLILLLHELKKYFFSSSLNKKMNCLCNNKG